MPDRFNQHHQVIRRIPEQVTEQVDRRSASGAMREQVGCKRAIKGTKQGGVGCKQECK